MGKMDSQIPARGCRLLYNKAPVTAAMLKDTIRGTCITILNDTIL
jgi:hypothetical protein